MKLQLASIVCCLVSVFLLHCSEEDPASRGYPRLMTGAVSDITIHGAVFNAEITYRGEYEIRQYGFVWSEARNPGLGGAEKVVYSENLRATSFSSAITSTMEADKVYYMRAFVVTNTHTVYGQEVTFTSLGSSTPHITAIAPLQSVPGDTLTIRGRGFSYLNRNNKVFFNTIATTPHLSSDSLLSVIIPNLSAQNTYSISLEVTGRKASHPQTLSIARPEIVDIEPSRTAFSQEVQVRGANFPLIAAYIGVKVGNTTAVVTESTGTEVTFVVPTELSQSVNSIIVTASDITLEAGALAILPPAINEVRPTHFTTYETDPIVIRGSNFSPIRAKNGIRIGGWPCEIISASWTELRVRLPRNLIPDREQSAQGVYDLEVQVLDQTVMLPQAITIDYKGL
jgi:hypothetical protein